MLCSGKVFYDISARLEQEPNDAVAVVRVEELYPFPERELRAAIESFGKLEEVVWLQEEPQNMGAWSFVEPRLRG